MFLDTSVIIEIFRNEKSSQIFKKIFKLIKNKSLFISTIQIGEISDWCLINDVDPIKRVSNLKEIINFVPLDEDICINGSKIKFRNRKKGNKKFSLIDGIILASARSINQTLITLDNDFKKINDVIVLQN